MTESLLTKLQREARENIDYVDEFQAAAIEEAIANTLKQAAEEIEGIKLGGEGKPIFVGANASQKDGSTQPSPHRRSKITRRG